jgi:hypothetical protein
MTAETLDDRTNAKLLTVAALYLLPITVGLRVEGIGPGFFLMVALVAISVSKVIHLREAVILKGIYPAGVLLADLSLILLLTVMFQTLAKPTGVASYLWLRPSIPAIPTADNLYGLLRNSWALFWVCGILLFLLIPVWTSALYCATHLTRKKLGRYILGWALGGLVSIVMLVLTWAAPVESTFAVYRVVAPVAALLAVLFLGLEVIEDKLFESAPNQDARAA